MFLVAGAFMQTDFLVLTVGFGIALFAIIICLILLFDDKKRKQSISYDPDDWIFKNFNLKMYDLIFHNEKLEEYDREKADKIGKKLGMNMTDYYEYKYISGSTGNIKNIIMNRLYGFILMIFAVLLLPFHYLLSSLMLLAGFFLAYYLQWSLKNAAIAKKTMVESQLPRFVDLLIPALKLKIPVDQAIKLTARSIECEFSTELLTIMENSAITSTSWPAAFEELASKYQVDILNDFVTNIVTAHNNGVDIYETVVRQSSSMKKTHRISLINRAKKLDTTMLAPITLFKLLPIIVLITYPAVMQSMQLLG